MEARPPARAADLLRRVSVLRSSLRASLVPLLDRASARIDADLPLVESALGRLDPILSLRGIRARVVEVRDETHDVKTFVLRPNARFGTFRPGSYVTLRLKIDGKLVQRSYSLSSAPGVGAGDGLIAITVKRVQGGHVSNWLADNLRAGDVLELGPAEGQFVLPTELPKRLLMLSAGSGITPVMSMLRQLDHVDAACEVDFVHFARSPRDLIFRDELTRIAARRPNVRLHFCVEESDDVFQGDVGRFSAELLARIAPQFKTLDTFLCGPAGFMKAVMQTLEAHEADLGKLRYERFNVELDPSQFLSHVQVVQFLRSGTQSLSREARTILDEAEQLGVRIESGCRSGNCGTCACLKKSGVVVDITTGRASGDGPETIYPCISVPRGTVAVEL